MFAVVALRRLLCLFALLGLVAGPVGVGTTVSAMVLSSGMQIEAMPGMGSSDYMSCCPDKEPIQKNKCAHACPWALICSSTILAHENTADRWRVDLASRALSHGLLQEGHLPSAIVEPPARPPKA